MKGFDDFARARMRDWGAPGVAIAVVKDGAVILSRGYGLRDVDNGLEVTPDTLFAIGSCTKAFTTMAMGMLADEGKLDWDAPVRTYLPDFTLHDPVASERMTPHDLVTHRSGLPRHDMMWHKSPFTRQELFARLRYLVPNKDFRAVWQYQNLMYMTAGYLSGQLAGQEWEDLVRERIFTPLGMRRSNLCVDMSRQDANVAQPYSEREHSVTRVPFCDISAVGPAGSINSSVVEMSAWLLLHLNGGLHGETRLISEGQLARMHEPQVVMPAPVAHDEMPYAAYGMGWVVQPYRGHPMLWHTGGIDGFSALVTLLPRDNSGIVVLSNFDSGPLVTILSRNLCDRLLGLDEIDWQERLKGEYDKAKAATAADKEHSVGRRVPETRPSHSLDSYSGDYEHPGYGVITITRQGDQLIASYNGKTPRLEHYHYDVFDLVGDLGDARFTASFSANVEGDIDSVAIPFEPTVPPIVFQRRPAHACSDGDAEAKEAMAPVV